MDWWLLLLLLEVAVVVLAVVLAEMPSLVPGPYTKKHDDKNFNMSKNVTNTFITRKLEANLMYIVYVSQICLWLRLSAPNWFKSSLPELKHFLPLGPRHSTSETDLVG